MQKFSAAYITDLDFGDYDVTIQPDPPLLNAGDRFTSILCLIRKTPRTHAERIELAVVRAMANRGLLIAIERGN